jgi:indolepyruvate ferredoxin oxidoreductase
MTDLLIACDLIVASGTAVLKTLRPGHTAGILNTDVAPTGEFQSNANIDLGADRLRAAVASAIDSGPIFDLHASQLATELTGDSIGTNILMLGYAAQKGLLPVSIASLHQAIKLNGTFVEGNLRTFALGRLAAHAPEALAQELGEKSDLAPLGAIDDVVASRMRLLTAYQNAGYADRYRRFIDDLRSRTRSVEGGDAFVRQVALTLARLMAYKDEYEVARLYADPRFLQRMREQFAGNFRMTFHLAPPLLPGRDASGRPRIREFGGWMLQVFKALARLKGLRGTAFDVFGYTAERRMERRLIEDYRALVPRIVDRIDSANLAAAIEIARAAGEIGGYGLVKDAAVQAYEARLPALLAAFEATTPQTHSRAA